VDDAHEEENTNVIGRERVTSDRYEAIESDFSAAFLLHPSRRWIHDGTTAEIDSGNVQDESRRRVEGLSSWSERTGGLAR
jgi:hypothetical protein